EFRRLVRNNGTIDETATVSVVTADQREAWLAGRATDLPLVTQQIRYRAPGAAEVWLVWGVEGWRAIPESARPTGTVLKNGKLHTPMVLEDKLFTTTIQVPPGTEVDLQFSVRKGSGGKAVNFLQDRDEEGRTFKSVAMLDGRMDVQSQWNP